VSENLDIAANRASRKYDRSEMARRLLWMAARPFFRLTPRPCFGLRALVLRLMGARIAPHVNIYNSAVIYHPWKFTAGEWSAVGEGVLIYNLGPVSIGSRVTVSQRAHLCAGTHDYTRADMPLLKPPIVVEDQAWICADAFVGPGVRVGQGAVVAARAVVVKDVEPWTVVAGNPARPIKRREIRQP
jgi:putative colanic acid biosynthesis acetyltransferase WcaF